eukprot:CAMPEP_0171171414 /NCGR_PEP_ID=MMETSP0790-20130122/9205_1 /TAXON_ID=2925 /ORGANISM="Alexandrium catenella, Strain OF101" /LENGTH=534 /DNA_ID=CAMNT_0011636267 /DNA_START=85 /DNA_END=1689 /DNA_ORIENTATION=-
MAPEKVQMEKNAQATKTSWETLRALARNRELVKVMLANGVVLVGKLVVLMLVLPALRSKIWGKEMAEFQAMVTLGLAVTAIVTSSHFGSFSDRFGRRAGAVVFGVCSFMPAWGVLVCGLNETGLYASCIGSVISGVGVNSNVLLLLASDVTDPADREAAFGAFAAVSLLLQFLLLGLPSLLIVTFEVFSSSPIVVLIYQVVLSALYFIIVATIRVPPAADAAPKAEASEAPPAACCSKLSAAASAVVAPLGHLRERSLRNLAACSFLLAFSGDLLMDVGSQFFRETLDLIPYGTLRQHQIVNVASSLPPQLLVLPGYVLVGLMAKRLGSLRLLLLLIPLSAALQGMGASLLWMPKVWFVGVVTAAQAYGGLLSVPLSHLVTVYAPQDRQGEVMGMMGAFQQGANMLGNLAVIGVTPLLKKSGLQDPLWVYFPAAGLIIFLALIPAGGIARGAGEATAKEEGQKATDVEAGGCRQVEDIEAPPVQRGDSACLEAPVVEVPERQTSPTHCDSRAVPATLDLEDSESHHGHAAIQSL